MQVLIGVFLGFIAFSFQNGLSAQTNSERLQRHVLDRLQQQHADSEDQTWFATTASFAEDWLLDEPFQSYFQSAEPLSAGLACDAASPQCDRLFQRRLCQVDADCQDLGVRCQSLEASLSPQQDEPKSMCLAPADQLVDRVYRLMVSADQQLDISSLSMPTGRFYEAMINALAQLSLKPTPVRVRFLFSSLDSVQPNFLNPPERILQQIADDINGRGGEAEALHLNLAWLSTSRLSWNHAKILIADRSLMINGGHNWWDADYLGQAPVFDVSLELSGMAASKTQDFFDLMWSKTRKFAAYPSEKGPVDPIQQMSSEPVPGVPVIGIGRLGVLGNNAADDALVALLEAAEQRILMSQQDLFAPLFSWLRSSWALDALIDALLRGVQVDIVQSNKGPFLGYGMVDAQTAFDQIIRLGERRARRLGLDAIHGRSIRSQLCAGLRVASFRFNADVDRWLDDSPLANHAKLMVVDDAAFYVGSQNFYPANLQEHGLIVSDEALTASLLQDYWQPLWQESQFTSASCGD